MITAVSDRSVKTDLHRHVLRVFLVVQIVLQVKVAIFYKALGDKDVMGLVTGQMNAPGIDDGGGGGQGQK